MKSRLLLPSLVILITLLLINSCKSPYPLSTNLPGAFLTTIPGSDITPEPLVNKASTITTNPKELIPTVTSTVKPKYLPSVIPTRKPSPTSWIEKDPAEQVLVIFGRAYRTIESLMFISRGAFDFEPNVLLYADGKLLIGDTISRLQEKKISLSEIDVIVHNLTKLGFFQLEQTYPVDINNPLYDLPAGFSRDIQSYSLGIIYVVGEEQRELRYMLLPENYLISPLRDIRYYLKHLSTSGMAPYQPDRLLVAIHLGREQPIAGEQPAIPWPESVTSPLKRSWDTLLFLEGQEAVELFSAAGRNVFQVFSYQGSEYSVFLRPLLPHECTSREYSPGNESDSQVQTFFICEDWVGE